jgi:uncharacterized membrane protein YgcG
VVAYPPGYPLNQRLAWFNLQLNLLLQCWVDGLSRDWRSRVAVVAWMLSGMLFIAIVAGAIALAFTLFGSGLGAYVGGRAIGGFGGGSNRTTFRGGGGGFGGGGASGRW